MELRIDYPKEFIPANVDELIKRLDSRDNKEVGRRARQEIERGEFKEGLITAVKKAIQERNKAESGINNRSMADAKVERMLTIKDSDGRRRARK